MRSKHKIMCSKVHDGGGIETWDLGMAWPTVSSSPCKDDQPDEDGQTDGRDDKSKSEPQYFVTGRRKTGSEGCTSATHVAALGNGLS